MLEFSVSVAQTHNINCYISSRQLLANSVDRVHGVGLGPKNEGQVHNTHLGYPLKIVGVRAARGEGGMVLPSAFTNEALVVAGFSLPTSKE